MRFEMFRALIDRRPGRCSNRIFVTFLIRIDVREFSLRLSLWRYDDKFS